ncbi:MAG: hypothetical protein D6706_06685 [Chloroflexi bacterium]|nr:MAG: hypothetical protein D6706_06685 [Chloroflexota bacterium]
MNNMSVFFLYDAQNEQPETAVSAAIAAFKRNTGKQPNCIGLRPDAPDQLVTAAKFSGLEIEHMTIFQSPYYVAAGRHS